MAVVIAYIVYRKKTILKRKGGMPMNKAKYHVKKGTGGLKKFNIIHGTY